MHQFNILEAKYISDYKIALTFDNGKKGIVNLEHFLTKDNCGIFKELRDKEKFAKFNVKYHTIVWNEELDLAPEFLYDLLDR